MVHVECSALMGFIRADKGRWNLLREGYSFARHSEQREMKMKDESKQVTWNLPSLVYNSRKKAEREMNSFREQWKRDLRGKHLY